MENTKYTIQSFSWVGLKIEID